MRIVELRHTIRADMPVYPGTEPPHLLPAGDYEKDGYRETLLELYSHTGTHIDAPAHIFPRGRTLDAFQPAQFAGQARVIDCRGLPAGAEIPASYITRYGTAAERAEFLLFCTGWDAHWGTDAYFGDYPCLSSAVLELIIAGRYKGIGFDVIGLDPAADARLMRHNRLFSARDDMINIENLQGLAQCLGGLFRFACLPLKFENSDGAPARAIAWLE